MSEAAYLSPRQFAPAGPSIGEVIADKLEEINKRNIRIETKLTRLVNGETDQGITAVDYELDFVDNVWCLRMLSGNVSIKQMVRIMTTEGVDPGEPVEVFVNGVYVITVKVG